MLPNGNALIAYTVNRSSQMGLITVSPSGQLVGGPILPRSSGRSDHQQQKAKPAESFGTDYAVVMSTRNNGDQPPELGWSKYLPKPATCIDIDADHLSVVGKDGSAVIARIFQ